MKTEYEIRVLEIDINKIINTLELLGAKKVGEYFQKRYVYDLNPVQNGKWIRLRTNGIKTTLTYKDIVSNTIDGTKEVEIEVDNFENTNELLNKIGYVSRSYQENKRIQYILDDVEIDIDSWPMIPTYMEIEGKNEETVNNMLEKLNVDKEKITTLNCDDIYKNFYNIDISKIKNLKFEN